MSSQYYSRSYLEAKRRFLERVRAHEHLSRQWSTAFGEGSGVDLTTDSALLKSPTRGSSRRLFVATSGLHGVEGFTGSAIQLALIDDWTDKRPDYDLLLIHGVNPFGFHFKRRVNRDHIDLNRNALLPGAPRDNPSYDRIRHLFNPGQPLAQNRLKQAWLMTRILGHAAVSKRTVKEAFLSGQFADTSGPFYGGEHIADEVTNVASVIEDCVQDYDIVAHFDLHTGYGIRGQMHLLCHNNDSRQSWLNLGFMPEPEEDGADYQMNGNLLAFVEHRLKKAKPSLLYRSVLLEFGTMGMELRKQLESMRIMIVDNSMGTIHDPSEEFCEMFNPSCPRWRNDVVQAAVIFVRRVRESLRPRTASARF